MPDSHVALIHIDFSENYLCGYASEIQSVHFGASHQQATLHTGMLYVKDHKVPFCTISPSRRHDPPAIWAHMEPVFSLLKELDPYVSQLHFFSDGPTTQYRQKANFYFLGTIPFSKGYTSASWNFFEASHGKGAPDGVGGSIKRLADNMKRRGKDIPDASSLYNSLIQQESAVKLYFIDPIIIDNYDKKLPLQIPVIKVIFRLLTGSDIKNYKLDTIQFTIFILEDPLIVYGQYC